MAEPQAAARALGVQRRIDLLHELPEAEHQPVMVVRAGRHVLARRDDGRTGAGQMRGDRQLAG